MGRRNGAPGIVMPGNTRRTRHWEITRRVPAETTNTANLAASAGGFHQLPTTRRLAPPKRSGIRREAWRELSSRRELMVADGAALRVPTRLLVGHSMITTAPGCRQERRPYLVYDPVYEFRGRGAAIDGEEFRRRLVGGIGEAVAPPEPCTNAGLI